MSGILSTARDAMLLAEDDFTGRFDAKLSIVKKQKKLAYFLYLYMSMSVTN